MVNGATYNADSVSEFLESVVVVCFSATVVISGGLEFAFISFLSIYIFLNICYRFLLKLYRGPEFESRG